MNISDAYHLTQPLGADVSAQEQAKQRAAHRLNTGDFDFNDVIESLQCLDYWKRQRLQSAIQDADSLRVGQMVSNAIYEYLMAEERK